MHELEDMEMIAFWICSCPIDKVPSMTILGAPVSTNIRDSLVRGLVSSYE